MRTEQKQQAAQLALVITTLNDDKTRLAHLALRGIRMLEVGTGELIEATTLEVCDVMDLIKEGTAKHTTRA